MQASALSESGCGYESSSSDSASRPLDSTSKTLEASPSSSRARSWNTHSDMTLLQEVSGADEQYFHLVVHGPARHRAQTDTDSAVEAERTLRALLSTDTFILVPPG